MPDETNLPIPVEVPWKLAATTQTLELGFPEDTTLSIFYHDPQTPEALAAYPNERLVYLKVTVSVSPCTIAEARATEFAQSHLSGPVPVIHMILDLGVTPVPVVTGGIRPYFHAASPTRRTMVETGVVGDAVYEGESESVGFGRSASQVHETMRSNVTTSTADWSVGVPGIARGGGSVSTTSVTGDRQESQYIETVQRDASEERRELLSHTTNVENVLTLLNAKHVGSPFLRFSLWPQPLRPLALDPNDPNLWYAQLLEARSGGIEGMQEFLAVVAVPRGADFCVQALLRRICVHDVMPTPPEPPTGHVSSNLAAPDYQRMLDYLDEVYPRGTPLDALDIDVLEAIMHPDTNTGHTIPVVLWWAFIDEEIVIASAGYPIMGEPTVPVEYRNTQFIYKTVAEVWLDMLRHEYLTELGRSPLERGLVLSHRTQLRTCFAAPTSGAVALRSAQSTRPPIARVPFRPTPSYAQPVRRNRASAFDEPRPSETVTRWNTLHAELIRQVSKLPSEGQESLSFASPAMVQLFLRSWAALPEHDPRNVAIQNLASILALPTGMIPRLCDVGATDLKRLAQVMLAAPRMQRRQSALSSVGACPPTPTQAWVGLTTRELDLIQQSIGAALQKPIPTTKTP